MSGRVCSVASCDAPVRCRGFCRKHYTRYMKHGDPSMRLTAKEGEGLAFLESALLAKTDDCILWPFAKISGYGTLKVDGKHRRVCRIVLRRTAGDPPSRLHVAAHLPVICHNRSCINSRHLRWATHAENAADRTLDGTEVRGRDSRGAVLNEAQVLKIFNDERPYKTVADEYGVSVGAISGIRSGKNWAWLIAGAQNDPA